MNKKEKYIQDNVNNNKCPMCEIPNFRDLGCNHDLHDVLVMNYRLKYYILNLHIWDNTDPVDVKYNLLRIFRGDEVIEVEKEK